MKSTRNTFLRSVAGTGAEDMSVTESRYKSSKAIDYGRQSRAVDIHGGSESSARKGAS